MSDQAPAEVRQKRVSPFRFLQQVREEGRKVTWPTRRETAITTGMVFVMYVVPRHVDTGLLPGTPPPATP